MASWSKGRTGRRLVTQLPVDVKCHLIKVKALTGASAGYQICEALRAKWADPSTSQFLKPSAPTPESPGKPCETPFGANLPSPQQVGVPSAPLPAPASQINTKPILPGKYDSMRAQKIDRHNIPWKV